MIILEELQIMLITLDQSRVIQLSNGEIPEKFRMLFYRSLFPTPQFLYNNSSWTP
jgi:hypothetical protein